jgi:hypothetical protein
MARNFYLILGVPSNASLEDIRDACRRLVKASQGAGIQEYPRHPCILLWRTVS